MHTKIKLLFKFLSSYKPSVFLAHLMHWLMVSYSVIVGCLSSVVSRPSLTIGQVADFLILLVKRHLKFAVHVKISSFIIKLDLTLKFKCELSVYREYT